ncbi:MAG: tetratricopeptide repeat protein [Deltaproteobacteria bacterium]|nr:tetratricopeptide repeat protein [Deltaproteobacteria bacterium]MBW2444644.1 tetratricopeptide repeat protein [Deltaproteobacteria bacterium]
MPWWKRAFDRPRAPKTSDAAVRQALYALLDHDLDTAQELLARAAQLDPDELDAYLMLGRLYRDRGEIGRAIRVHQNLLLRPELGQERGAEVLRELASDFRAGGFLRRAIASFEEVLSRTPKDARSLRELASLLATAQDHERAIEIERRLAKVEGRDAAPRESELHLELARSAEAEGRAGDARKALKRATKRNPKNVEAWVLLGRIETAEKRTRQALSAWRKVPEVDRCAGPRVYPELAAGYAALGKERDYEKYLALRIEGDANDSDARLALATSLSARGETDAALDEIRRVLAHDGSDLEAHAALGRTLVEAGREGEALKAYAELLAVLERPPGTPPPAGLE